MADILLGGAELLRVLDRLPAPLFLQTKGRFAHVNGALAKLLGYEAVDLIGRPVLSVIPAHWQPTVIDRIRNLNQDRRPMEPAQLTYLRADDQETPVETWAVPVDHDGEPGALVFVRDLSDERFRSLVDALPYGVFLMTDGQFRYLNAEAQRLFGGGAAPLRGPVDDFLAGIGAEAPGPGRLKRQIVRTLRGDEVPVEWSTTPFAYQGNPGSLVVVRDLTDEDAARQDLAVKDRLLRLTNAMAKVGGWEYDPATGIGTWSDEVARIHDLSPYDATSVSLGLSVYTPESRARIEAAMAAAAQEAEPYDLVLEMVTIRGRRKWVRTQGRPVVREGKVVQVQGTFQDVTETWLADRARAQEQERLAVTLRSIGDGVITTDIEGRVVLMSRTAEELTGWTQAEAFGHPLIEVMPLVNRWTKRPLDDLFAAVMTRGTSIELPPHTLLRSRDGRERIVADSAAPILDSEGGVQGVVLVFRDMTEKERLAEAIQRAQNLESIGLLAAGIAHDFNNLLSGLFGQIQLAAEKVRQGRPADAEVNFDRALGVFDRARDLTGQLMTFSKGGAPARVPCDLPNLVRRTVQFALAGSNVGAVFHIPETFPALLGDPNQLAQVFDNLVINARQAMAQGGNLEVRLERRDEGKRWAVLTLRDEGPGIPPEVISKVFDPFYTTKPGGHGLGLAAVNSIVQRHDGRVEVESPAGGGAIFRVFLPLP